MELQDMFNIADRIGTAIQQRLHGWMQRSESVQVTAIGADGLPTTRADKAAEETALQVVREAGWPCQLLSEECGLVHISDDPQYTVILDPIDGTANVGLGLPMYSVSIAFASGESILFGYVRNLATGDVFWAGRGCGAYWNGQRIHSAPTRELEGMRLAISRPYTQRERDYEMKLVEKAGEVRLSGCPSLDMCLVAAGRLDLFTGLHDPSLHKIWDIAAALVICEEAGARVWYAFRDGDKPISLDPKARLSVAAAATPELLEAARSLWSKE